MSRIASLKFADHKLGTFLVRVLPKPHPSCNEGFESNSILLIRPGGIGDAIHLIPAIKILRAFLPGVAIDILAERRNEGAFALCPGIRRVFLYDRPGQLLQLLRIRYDVVIDTEQWHRLSAIVARLIRSRVKIGYATSERSRLFTHTVPYRHDDYEVESFLNLLKPLDISIGSPPDSPWLQIPAAAHKVADELLGDLVGKPFVVLFPGASIVEKRWPWENFCQVAGWCVKVGLNVVVVGGSEDRAAGERLVAEAEVTNLAGRTSLAETAAILGRARVVVSGDSGVLHLAAGVGCPSVALFGPGNPAKWAPRGPRHVVLNRQLSCSPCTRFGYTPSCTHGHRCMREISVDEVTRAIEAVVCKT